MSNRTPREAVDRTPGAYHIESSAQFTRPRIQRYEGQALLFDITVESSAASSGNGAGVLEAGITDEVRRLVMAQMPGVTPFVRVTVVMGPPGLDECCDAEIPCPHREVGSACPARREEES